MDLPEFRWVELLEQFAEWNPDEYLAVRSDHARVFRISLEIADFLDGHQPYLVAGLGVDPAQVCTFVCSRIVQSLHESFEIRRPIAQACTNTLACDRQPRRS